MSGANGGSGTVTNQVPEPGTLVFLATGLAAGFAQLKRKRLLAI
jgi:hypothetical protein